MFFIFQLLVIGNYFLPSSSSLTLQKLTNSSNYKRNIDQNSYKDVPRNNASSSTQSRPMFITLQNFTRNRNLQQNVFDKMLSEEMLSIKNYMHERDMTYTPTYQALPKIYMVTPTLVVKKHWLTVKEVTTEPTTVSSSTFDLNSSSEELYKDNLETNSPSAAEPNVDHSRGIDNVAITDVKEKVLGLRSLHNYQSRAPALRKEVYLREGKLCTCMVTNPSTACSHVCTGSSTKRSSLCTRSHDNLLLNTLSSASPPYLVHPAYPLPYNPNYFVHLTVPSDIYDYETSTRKRKHKHHKKTKRPHHNYDKDRDKYLYYDNLAMLPQHYDDFDYKIESEGATQESGENNNNGNSSGEVKPVGEKIQCKGKYEIGPPDHVLEAIRKFFSKDDLQMCCYAKKSTPPAVVTNFFIDAILPILLHIFIF